MKVKLSVAERVIAQNLLPQTGSYITFKIVLEARTALSFSDEELALLNFVETQGDNGMASLRWTENVVDSKEFDISDAASRIIADALKELDAEEKLTEQHMSLYDKFVLTTA